MIVVCQKCETRFRVDPARIPARGARVRCSRCKTAFFVRHPEASEEGAIDDLVNETTLRGVAVPDPAQDLTQPAPSVLDPAAPGRVVAGGEDEQWEFDDEGSSGGRLGGLEPGPGAGPMATPPEAPAAQPRTQAPGPAESAQPAAPADPGTGSEFGTIDDFDLGSDVDEDDLGLDEEDLGLGEGGAFGSPPEDFGADPAPPPQAPPEPARAPAIQAAAPPSGDLDELGSPNEWNFLGEAPPPPAVEPQASAAAVEPHAAAASTPRGPAASKGRARAVPGNLLVAAGWALAGAGLLAGLWLSAQPLPQVAPRPVEPSRHPLAQGEARDVLGRHLENAIGGPVFVVSGTFVPGGGPPSRLRVEWRDAEGRAMPGGVLAGPALDEVELREQAPALIRRKLAERSAELGRGGRFDAVFPRVPPKAVEIALRLEELPPPPTTPFVGPPWPPPTAGAL